MTCPKVLVIGLDGVTWKLLKPLIAQDKMPTIKKLIENGSYGVLESTIPPYTYLGWKCYSTGKNPAKLGVFFWYKIKDLKVGKLELCNSTSYKGAEIWDLLGKKGYKCGVIAMPMTYPPKQINGFMISGLMAFEESNYTFPRELKNELVRKYDYKVSQTTRFRLNPDIKKSEAAATWINGIKEIKKLTKMNFSISSDLLKSEQIDFLHLTIFYTDQMEHFVWKPMIEGDLKLAKRAEDFWTTLDKEIDGLLNSADSDTNVFIFSDHGMSLLRGFFHLNNWLEAKGYLNIKRGETLPKALFQLGLNKESAFKLYHTPFGRFFGKIMPTQLTKLFFKLKTRGNVAVTPDQFYQYIDWKKTKAAMLGDGLIVINLQRGTTKYEQFREKLKTEIEDITDPRTGKRIFKVKNPMEIYSGDFLDDFDLVVLPEDGYSMLRSYVKDCPANWAYTFEDGLSADHDLSGIFISYGPNIKKGIELKNATIYDLAPTILYIFGIHQPKDMDGRVLTEIVQKTTYPKNKKPLPSPRNKKQS